jgi:hypothetical protein
VYALSLAILVAGIAFALYAGVQWLQTARWQPLTVSGALAAWPETREWIARPQNWLGLHRLVRWILRVPVFIIVTLVGLALFALTRQETVKVETPPTWSTR